MKDEPTAKEIKPTAPPSASVDAVAPLANDPINAESGGPSISSQNNPHARAAVVDVAATVDAAPTVAAGEKSRGYLRRFADWWNAPLQTPGAGTGAQG